MKFVNLFIILSLVIVLLLIFGCVTPSVCGNGVCEVGEDENNCSINNGGDCPPNLMTCSALGGITCSQNEKCSTYTLPASDSDFCCIQGQCQIQVEPDENKILVLELYKHHDDTTIKLNLNLDKLTDFDRYSSLGFIVYKENGVEYHPSGDPVFIEGGFIKGVLQKKSYKKVITNLNPDSEYEICLTGFFKDYTSTGNFNCEIIKTHNKKVENALILINYDVEQIEINLIDEWISLVRDKNPLIEIKKLNVQNGTSPETLLNQLKKEYDSSNLNYLVFIGYDLPVFEVEGGDFGSTPIKRVGMYSTLSNIIRGEFENENDLDPANEVIISVIRPQSNKISEYFERLIKFYKGEIIYPNKILLADAMIESEKSIIPSYFQKAGYSFADIDLVTGITAYSDYNEGKKWREEYFTKLSKNSYKLLILNAHGSRQIHYPCDSQCVDYNFIDTANPSAQFIIGVSCNIGNVMTNDSPMVSYVFNGNSISALGAEVPVWDGNATASKYAFDKLVIENKTIGEVGKRFGLIVIGDPFIVN